VRVRAFNVQVQSVPPLTYLLPARKNHLGGIVWLDQLGKKKQLRKVFRIKRQKLTIPKRQDVGSLLASTRVAAGVWASVLILNN